MPQKRQSHNFLSKFYYYFHRSLLCKEKKEKDSIFLDNSDSDSDSDDAAPPRRKAGMKDGSKAGLVHLKQYEEDQARNEKKRNELFFYLFLGYGVSVLITFCVKIVYFRSVIL